MVEQFLNIINNGLPSSERVRLANLILCQENKKPNKKEDFSELDAMLINIITKKNRKK